MVTISRASALAVLVGISLLVWSVGFLTLPNSYEFHVDQEGGNVSATYAYENLSAEGKQAFDRARKADDGTAIVHGEENVPERFYYIGDHQPDDRGEYRIIYEGEAYHLTTYAGGGLPILFNIDKVLLALYGVGLAVWGVVSANSKRVGDPWIPVGWAVLLMTVGIVAPWNYDDFLGFLLAGPGTLFVTGVAGLFSVSRPEQA